MVWRACNGGIQRLMSGRREVLVEPGTEEADSRMMRRVVRILGCERVRERGWMGRMVQVGVR